MNRLDIPQTAQLLLSQNDILILTHQSPDGDTMGSGYSLCLALQQLGKRAMVLCTDPIPKRMTFVAEHLDPALTLENPDQAKFVVAVDIADVKLMGPALAAYQLPDAVDLCIDHHPSNKEYAKNLLLCGEEAAACQILFDQQADCRMSLSRHLHRYRMLPLFQHPAQKPSDRRKADGDRH